MFKPIMSESNIAVSTSKIRPTKRQVFRIVRSFAKENNNVTVSKKTMFSITYVAMAYSQIVYIVVVLRS